MSIYRLQLAIPESSSLTKAVKATEAPTVELVGVTVLIVGRLLSAAYAGNMIPKNNTIIELAIKVFIL